MSLHLHVIMRWEKQDVEAVLEHTKNTLNDVSEHGMM
jgi:hypothetical protein